MLHDVPLHPALRHRVRERPRPQPPHGVFLVVQLEERLGRRSHPELRRILLLVNLSPSPGPGGCVPAPWSAVLGVHLVVRVVQHRSQGHADGLLFVTKPRAHPPLSAAPRNSSTGSLARLCHEKRPTMQNVNAQPV